MLRIEQRLQVAASQVATDVAGPACVYAIVRLTRGTISYLRGNGRVAAPRRYVLWLPRFAVVQASLERCDVTSSAWVFRAPSIGGLPREAMLWPVDDDREPTSVADVLNAIQAARATTDIGRHDERAMPTVRAKAIIDRHYAAPLSIGAVAARLNQSPAQLTRTFKRAYGLAPVQYRHQVRVVDAFTRLANGVVPMEVFQDVGFNDLGRFYKIFRRLACAPPGSYRPG